MLAEFKRVRVIGVGFYDIDGTKYYYLDLHDPNGREPVLRASLARDIPAADVDQLRGRVEDGDAVVRLDLKCEVTSQTKVVRGTDRTAVTHRVTIEHYSPALPVPQPVPLESAA